MAPLNLKKNQDGVISFYRGASVFITGGSGFVGKAIIEKLLRTCDGIQTIYVLLRGKRKVAFEERHIEMMKNKVFDIIRDKRPELLDKVVPIQGDVTLPMFGISPQDQEIIAANVNIVIHSAASVNFVDKISDAIKMNTQAIKFLLEFCYKIKNLKSVVHVSTAYSNANRSDIAEKIYKCAMDPETMIQCANILPKDTMDLVAGSLDGHPNTYTYTKSLAENLISGHFGKLPIAIVRPAMVASALNEPFPGWLDQSFGLTDNTGDIYRGALRVFYGDKNGIADVVPLDFVVNTCISASWHHTTLKTNEVPVYNCTSGPMNPITWDDFTKAAVSEGREYPSICTMLYPNFKFVKSRALEAFWHLFSHLLPSFLMDLLLWAKGEKRIMVKAAKRRQARIHMITEFFINNTYLFGNENMRRMIADMKELNEDTDFPVDLSTMNWNKYLHDLMMAIRQYHFKDSIETLPAARKNLQRLLSIHRVIHFFTGYVFTD